MLYSRTHATRSRNVLWVCRIATDFELTLFETADLKYKWIQCHPNKSIGNGYAYIVRSTANHTAHMLASEVRRAYTNRIVIRARNRYKYVGEKNERHRVPIHAHANSWIRASNPFKSSRIIIGRTKWAKWKSGMIHPPTAATAHISCD